jgi:hypothetical protein
MRTDRDLRALSKTHTLDTLAEHFRRETKAIMEKASRLGLTIKRDRKLEGR